MVNMSENGRIVTDDHMRTGVEGLFAAGDIREKLVNQVATAVGDGATAATAVEHYLSSLS